MGGLHGQVRLVELRFGKAYVGEFFRSKTKNGRRPVEQVFWKEVY